MGISNLNYVVYKDMQNNELKNKLNVKKIESNANIIEIHNN